MRYIFILRHIFPPLDAFLVFITMADKLLTVLITDLITVYLNKDVCILQGIFVECKNLIQEKLHVNIVLYFYTFPRKTSLSSEIQSRNARHFQHFLIGANLRENWKIEKYRGTILAITHPGVAVTVRYLVQQLRYTVMMPFGDDEITRWSFRLLDPLADHRSSTRMMISCWYPTYGDIHITLRAFCQTWSMLLAYFT